MSEKLEDPFFRSLRVLRQLLKQDDAADTTGGVESESVSLTAQGRAAQHQQQLSDSPSNRHEVAEASTQTEFPQHEEEESTNERLAELQTKLREADTAVRKERALRKSMERAFEDLTTHRKILTEELEKTTSLNKPLQDELALLRKEKIDERKSFDEKTKKHLEEMDNLHQQKQSALSQRDSMEARMLGSEKLAKELQVELTNVKNLLKEEEWRHNEANQSLEKLKESSSVALETSQAKIQTLTNEVRYLGTAGAN
jgi:chromosome segregation ATPase